MASITLTKDNKTRTIELLTAKKNEDADHIKIGNYYAELTENTDETLGTPRLKFTKDSTIKYIKEIFVMSWSENFGSWTGTSSGESRTYGNISFYLPHRIKSGTFTLKIYSSKGFNQNRGQAKISVTGIGEVAVGGTNDGDSGTRTGTFSVSEVAKNHHYTGYVAPTFSTTSSGSGSATGYVTFSGIVYDD